MPKISELTSITDITDDDTLMITDAESGASRKITWSNVQSSITTLSGGISSTPYKFNTTTSAEPGSKTLRFNSTVPANVTEIYISKTNNAGVDLSTAIPILLTAGVKIYIQVEGNTAKYLTATVSSVTTVNNSFTVAVSGVTAGTLPSNNEKLVLAVIGNNSESTKADITGDTFTGALTIATDTNNGSRLTLSQANDGTDAPDIRFEKARGTIASPTTVQALDVISRFQAFAYDGTAYVQGGNFGFTASDGDGNATWAVKTRVTDTLSTRIEVDNTGTVNVAGDFIHTPSSSKTPTTNGELMFEATNDTTITVKYKGSDGVVRTGTISLS